LGQYRKRLELKKTKKLKKENNMKNGYKKSSAKPVRKALKGKRKVSK
jgi:hypothetical protein